MSRRLDNTSPRSLSRRFASQPDFWVLGRRTDKGFTSDRNAMEVRVRPDEGDVVAKGARNASSPCHCCSRGVRQYRCWGDVAVLSKDSVELVDSLLCIAGLLCGVGLRLGCKKPLVIISLDEVGGLLFGVDGCAQLAGIGFCFRRFGAAEFWPTT